MSASVLIWLIILVFITSAVGVVTGSNSLVIVPLMFQFGIEPKTALATNMFGLTFMSIGASIPFLRQGTVSIKKLSPFIFLTLISSTLGAILVGLVSSKTIPIIVSVSMIAVSIFILIHRDKGVAKAENSPPEHRFSRSQIIAYILTFLLGIYGGLYSGGYVTMLTAAYVAFLGMTFTESVAATKVINVFSSLIATIVFMWQGLVDYKLGLVLAVVMFIAAYAGAGIVTRLNDLWLRRIFLTTVLLLAIKTIFDFTMK